MRLFSTLSWLSAAPTRDADDELTGPRSESFRAQMGLVEYSGGPHIRFHLFEEGSLWIYILWFADFRQLSGQS